MLPGNPVPNGGILKPSAAAPEFMKHRGRAVVFEDIDETCVTAYGTVVLHVAPEVAAGGTLALIENGDAIEPNPAERLTMAAIVQGLKPQRV